MKIKCPACNKIGNPSDFPYLGNQRSKCNFCNNILENASQCPKCKSIMLAKHTVPTKLNPFGALFHSIKGDLKIKCRECDYLGFQGEFKTVWSFRGNITISPYEEVKEPAWRDNLVENLLGKGNGDLAIFCGAGISINSGLPSANTLKQYILEELLTNKEDLDKIFNSNMPFELFIELLSKNSDIKELLDLFRLGEPNATHYFIAKLAKHNYAKTIVTTNFDMLIEKALTREGVRFDLYCSEEEFSKINFDDANNRIKLIKIHGTADETKIDTMRTTLQMIASKMFSEQRKRIIRYLLVGGNHSKLLVLGYSCSDFFDINRFVHSISPAECNKEILYIRHERGGCKSKTENELELFKEFDLRGIFKRIRCDADALIKKLWTADNFKEKFGQYPGILRIEEDGWKKRIDNWSSQLTRPGSKNYIIGSLFFHISKKTEEEDKTLIGYEKTKEYLKLALHELKGDESVLTTMCYLLLGSAHLMESNYEKSIENSMSALYLSRKLNNKRMECDASLNLGKSYHDQGKMDDAIDYYEEALRIAISENYTDGLINSYSALGCYYSSIGNFHEAKNYFEKGLDVAQNFGLKFQEIMLISNLANVYKFFGYVDIARKYYDESIEVSKNLGDDLLKSHFLRLRAELHHSTGNTDMAIKDFGEAQEILKKLGNKRELSACHAGLANVYLYKGELDNALINHKEALRIAKEIHSKEGEAASCLNIATIYKDLGDFYLAKEFGEKALRLAHDINSKVLVIRCSTLFGAIYYHLRHEDGKNVELSIEYNQRAAELAKELDDKLGEAGCYVSLGNCYHYLKDFSKSIDLNYKALEIFEKFQNPAGVSICLTNLGNNYCALRDFQQALNLLERALAIAKQIQDREGERIIGQNIDNVYRMMHQRRR